MITMESGERCASCFRDVHLLVIKFLVSCGGLEYTVRIDLVPKDLSHLFERLAWMRRHHCQKHSIYFKGQFTYL